MKKIFSLFAAVLFAGSMMAGALELYTLDATDSGNQGTNNSYTGNCDITVGVITWNVTGNSTMSPWRIGGKSLSNTNRAVYSKTAYGSALDSIVLDLGAASSVTINSIKLTHSLNADFSDGTEIAAASPAANSSMKFAPTGGFPANSYFKIVFNVTVSSTSNKFLEFKKLHFWGQAPTEPEISCADEIDFGVVYGKAPAASKTLEVSAYNLTENIAAALGTGAPFALHVATLSKDGGDFVVNFSASASGDFSDNLTLSANSVNKVVALSAVAVKTEHEGTTADPFVVDEVRAIAFAHADNVTTKDSMSITGQVKTVKSLNSNRLTFSIGTGNDTVLCYNTYDAKGQATLDLTSIHVGDIVVVRGKLQNYKSGSDNIAEITYGKLLSVSTTLPTISATPTSLDLGTIYQNSDREDAKKTFTLMGANLTSQVKLMGSGASVVFDRNQFVDPQMDGSIDITVGVYPYTTDTKGTFEATISVKGTGSNPDGIDQDLVTVTWKVVAAPTPTGTFAEFTGTLVEGDYLLTYDDAAIKAEVASNRLAYVEIEPAENKVVNPDAAIVWHLAKVSENWTIYNEAELVYAGSTSAKNQAALLANASTDNALWVLTEGEGVYDFANVARAAGSDSGNKWLRKNGTYGFACYAEGTGGSLTLYKKESTPTAIDNAAVEGKAVKFIENGVLYIEKAGVRYNVMGQAVK